MQTLHLDELPETPRLVNHFAIGADPEFALTKNGDYIYAENVGLNTLCAFGCDMAGRQAELRAYPSRFALEVVASMMEALRWMAHCSHANNYEWIATASIGHDGCAGHVHFGKKREIGAKTHELDSCTLNLLNTGILSREGQERRRQVTDDHYGKFGDIRLKTHGFEYRTTPTWLYSPWGAFLTLVVYKLIGYQGKPSAWNVANPKQSVLELLTEYAGKDEDAAIAFAAFERYGWPVAHEKDFRPYWGISTGILPARNVDRTFIPSAIKPSKETCTDLFSFFVHGVPLPVTTKLPVPTWEPLDIPKGIFRPTVQPHTLGHLPDVVMDLLSKWPIHVKLTGDFRIETPIHLPLRKIAKELRDYAPPQIWDYRIGPHRGGIEIGVSAEFRHNLDGCKLLHEVVGNPELFPACSYKDFKNVDWSRWESTSASSPAKLIGKRII